MDLAAANIQYLLKHKREEVHSQLESSIIEEVVERAVRFYRADLQYDNSLLFETLMRLRNCESIFQLLDQERDKVLETEEHVLEQEGVRPTLTWKI